MRLRCARPPQVQTLVERPGNGQSVHLVYSNQQHQLLQPAAG